MFILSLFGWKDKFISCIFVLMTAKKLPYPISVDYFTADLILMSNLVIQGIGIAHPVDEFIDVRCSEERSRKQKR